MKDGILYENGLVRVLINGDEALIMNGPYRLKISVSDLQAIVMKIANGVIKRTGVTIDFSGWQCGQESIDRLVNEIYGR